jgi:hypothetical protein
VAEEMPLGPDAQLEDSRHACEQHEGRADDRGQKQRHALGQMTVDAEEGDAGGLAVFEDEDEQDGQ